MSSGSSPPGDERSVEERAEELVERITHDASRWLSRFVGRAREEIEDLVADARSLNEHGAGTNAPPAPAPADSGTARTGKGAAQPSSTAEPIADPGPSGTGRT